MDSDESYYQMWLPTEQNWTIALGVALCISTATQVSSKITHIEQVC